jgi:hypothetical protein
MNEGVKIMKAHTHRVAVCLGSLAKKVELAGGLNSARLTV